MLEGNWPEDSTPDRALWETIRLHYARAHSLFDRVGAHPGQPLVLMALTRLDGQSQKSLSEALHLRPATLTVMLGRMEKAGLVERRADPTDQRVSRVFITAQGRAVQSLVSEAIDTLRTDCYKGFSDSDLAEFHRLLLKVKGNLLDVCGKADPWFHPGTFDTTSENGDDNA